MQETLHLPTRKNYDAHPTNPQYLRAMKHVGRLFRERNAAGRLGFFIDCWEHRTHTIDNPKVMFDENGNVISMARYRAANTWGDSYITGEFAYFIRPYSKDLVPYAALADQFAERHVAGISLHNFTIIDRVNGNRPRTYVKPSPEIYASARRAISTLGYRIVLGCPKVARTAEGAEASFTLANVGTSRAYHSYNRLHVFVEQNGKVLEELTLDEYRQFGDDFDEGLYAAIDLENCVEKRVSKGGTGKASVLNQIEYIDVFLAGQS